MLVPENRMAPHNLVAFDKRMLEYSVQRVPDRECWTVLMYNVFQTENVRQCSVQHILDRKCWTVLTNNVFQAENVEEYSHTSYSRQKMLDSTHVWLIPDRRVLDSTHRQRIPIRKCWTVLTYIVFQTEKVGEYSHTVFQTDILRTVLTYNVFMIENVGQYSRTTYSRQRMLDSIYIQRQRMLDSSHIGHNYLRQRNFDNTQCNVFQSGNVGQYSHRTYLRQRMLDSTQCNVFQTENVGQYSHRTYLRQRMLDSTHTGHI